MPRLLSLTLSAGIQPTLLLRIVSINILTTAFSNTKLALLFPFYFKFNFSTPFFQIHWFSIFNSFMMVIFLTGLVSMILMRTLRRDYAHLSREVDELDVSIRRLKSLVIRLLIYFFFPQKDLDVSDELGWKQIHGDVFRPPSKLILFSAMLGTGHQLILLVFSVLFLSIIGTYYRRYDLSLVYLVSTRLIRKY